MQILYTVILVFNYIALVYMISISLSYFLQLVFAGVSLSRYVKYLRYSDYRRYINSDNMIPVSILVPAYNEETTIVESVKNLLKLDYPAYEVVVINDGSKDETLRLLQEAFCLEKIDRPYKRSLQTKDVLGIYCSPMYSNLVVVDKANGGKADALNVGINLSRYPIFASMDADSILEKQALIRIIMPFQTDNNVIGVGGVVCVSNGCIVKNGEIREIRLPKTPLGKLQTIEYLRSFFMGRIGAAQTDSLLIISGAFGSFKKDVVIRAGGYTTNCIGEDMELVVKLHSLMRKEGKKYAIKFLADPICWTQPPESLRDLYKQRKRWQIGLINTLLRHKNMLFNPKFGKIGMITVPYYWIFEFLGPIFETCGYIIVPLSLLIGVINLQFFLVYFILVVVIGMILSTGALLQESYSMRRFPKLSQVLQLSLYALIDNLGYRQFNTIIRVMGALGYKSSKHSWGSMKRKKFENN